MHDRLYRSRDERVIFGVCGGLAERYEIDPSLVRIVFALLVLSAGIGLGLYIVMALVVPEEPWAAETSSAMPPPAPMAPSTDAAHFVDADAGAPDAAAPGLGSAAMGAAGAAASGAAPARPMTPREQRRANRAARRGRGDDRAGMIVGAILIIVGGWFLVRRYLPTITDDFLGPLVLIGLGLVLVVGAVGVRRSDDGERRPR